MRVPQRAYVLQLTNVVRIVGRSVAPEINSLYDASLPTRASMTLASSQQIGSEPDSSVETTDPPSDLPLCAHR
jgi:hypothetical protein